jgi:hypothetical protein
MAPPLLLFFLLLPLLTALADGHQHLSSYGSSALSDWRPAKASYYAADPEDAIGTLPNLPAFITHPIDRNPVSRPWASLVRRTNAASTHKDFSSRVPLERNFPPNRAFGYRNCASVRLLY